MQSLREIFEPEFLGMNNRDSAEQLGHGFLALAQGCLLGTGEIINGPGTSNSFDLLSGNKILGGISTNTETYVACNEPGDRARPGNRRVPDTATGQSNNAAPFDPPR